MSEFYIIAGIEGVGKSFFAKQLSKCTHIQLVDADDYYIGRQESYGDARCVWLDIMKDLNDIANNNKDALIVVNGLTESERQQFNIWFPNVNTHLLWVFDKKSNCWKGTQMRERKVPKDVFETDWARMEIPCPGESGWKTITMILNDKTNKPVLFNLKGNIDEYIENGG